MNPGKASQEWENNPPVMRLNYTYKHPFTNVANGFLKKYNWESRMSLTSIAHVQQTDDDTLTFWRRVESLFGNEDPFYERVTINRKTRTILNDEMWLNDDKSENVRARQIFTGKDNDTTENELIVGATTGKD